MRTMKNKRIVFIKILGLILIAFFASTFLIKNLFFVNSPRVNTTFIAKLKQTPSLIASLPSKLFNSLTKNKSVPNEAPSNLTVKEQAISEEEANKAFSALHAIAPPPDAFFKSLSKGVSAAEQNNGQVILKIEKGTQYKVRRFKLSDGQIIDVVDLTGD